MSQPEAPKHEPRNAASRMRPLPAMIFASRWLQLPLYLGLIIAQGCTWCTS